MKHERTAVTALAGVMAAMVTDHHAADILADVVSDCVDVLGAGAAAIMVVGSNDDLSLLSSSSHRAAELEMLQMQHDHGPCVEAISLGPWVSCHDRATMVERWGEVGHAILAAGFGAVDAFPVRWRGRVLGVLNVFHPAGGSVAADLDVLGQALADVAALVIVHIGDVPADQITARVQEAVAARSTIEQAKGALAYLHELDPAEAYDLLRRKAVSSGSLTETALLVLRGQYERA